MLESIFLNGLKNELQAKLKLYDYEDLVDLMDRALMVEEKNVALSKRREPVKNEWRGTSSKFRSTWSNSSEKKEGGNVSGEKKEEKQSEVIEGRKLDPAELEERSKKGLCFKCGDKWNKGHVCKFKHMKLMLCEVEGDSEEEENTGQEEITVLAELKTLQLSLHSKEGLTSNKSFKVWGVIGGRRVLILIDSGATSNFIAPWLVKELQLALLETPIYVIEIGTGELVRNHGVCKDLEFEVQGVKFQQNFFLMELGGTDVVLGMDWLASLGNIEANFKNLSLKWTQTDHQYIIKGDPALSTVQASWKAMMKALQGEGEGYYVECRQAVLEDGSEGTEAGELGDLLAEFEVVFEMPSGLPPPRKHDHSIELKPEAPIPNIRPYRYPFYQKNERENCKRNVACWYN